MLGFGLDHVKMARAPISRFVEAAAGLGTLGRELCNDLGRLGLADLAEWAIKTSVNFISPHVQEDMAA